MPQLALTNVDYSIGARALLRGVTLSVEPGEHIGLVGRNGTGKTTLLRLIAGELRPDRGEAALQRGTRVGLLEQEPDADAAATLFDIAESAFADLHAAHEAMHEIAARMAETSGAELDALMKKYERLEADMQRLGGYAVEHRIVETLHGLGFTDDQFKLPATALSGGQRRRAALAKLLLESPDLLLLDEPTNHLDIDGRLWLEDFLADEFRGTVIVVSHDRYLLDRVAARIVEIEATGGIATYPGNYAQFRELRLQRRLTEQRVYDKQQDRIRSEQRFIDRYRAGQRAKQAQGRQARLQRYKRDEAVERPIELDVMNLRLPPAKRSGDIVVSAEGLSKRYDGLVLFDGLDVSIQRGERIGVIGPNGSGKTTLARCLIGEMAADSGRIRLGSNVNIGHFSQLHEGVDLELPVWRYLQSVILGQDGGARASEQQARDLAGAFLFSGDEQDKPLGVLSGGERSRAILAGLVAGGHNLLILDEPTNHFDIPSAERLEQALDPETGYDGTLLLISHDRALLDACVDRLIVLDGRGGVRLFDGNYSRWREAMEREGETKAQAGMKADVKAKMVAKRQAAGKSRVEAKARADAKPQAAAIEKMSLTKLEARIEAIETRIREIDDILMDHTAHRDGERLRILTEERARLTEEIEPLEFEWSRRAEEG